MRSVFVIGAEDKIKLSLTYPKSTGRNFDEILRVIDSLQLTCTHTLATPADWSSGDRVIIPPGMSTEDAKKEFQNVEELKPYLRFDIADGLARLLADTYGLYLKTHNYHWNVVGPMSFLACPCHLPLTLAAVAAVLGGTGIGVALRDHTVLAGVVIALAWVTVTASANDHRRSGGDHGQTRVNPRHDAALDVVDLAEPQFGHEPAGPLAPVAGPAVEDVLQVAVQCRDSISEVRTLDVDELGTFDVDAYIRKVLRCGGLHTAAGRTRSRVCP